jgi:hypothetical protein
MRIAHRSCYIRPFWSSSPEARHLQETDPMPTIKATDATTRSACESKRPYVRPALKRYGDLAQLTQAKGMNGPNSDGALANNNKTV